MIQLSRSKNLTAIAKRHSVHEICKVYIDGGNHAGFGNYGKQRGDRAADCTPGEQQRSAAEAIARFTDADETAVSR